jgi:hypothetical protein
MEYPSVEQFILRIRPTAASVSLNEVDIREFRLGILIKIFHVGVSWRTIEVEVVIFDILPVIGFAVGQAEHALLKYRILAIPQRD